MEIENPMLYRSDCIWSNKESGHSLWWSVKSDGKKTGLSLFTNDDLFPKFPKSIYSPNGNTIETYSDHALFKVSGGEALKIGFNIENYKIESWDAVAKGLIDFYGKQIDIFLLIKLFCKKILRLREDSHLKLPKNRIWACSLMGMEDDSWFVRMTSHKYVPHDNNEVFLYEGGYKKFAEILDEFEIMAYNMPPEFYILSNVKEFKKWQNNIKNVKE